MGFISNLMLVVAGVTIVAISEDENIIIPIVAGFSIGWGGMECIWYVLGYRK